MGVWGLGVWSLRVQGFGLTPPHQNRSDEGPLKPDPPSVETGARSAYMTRPTVLPTSTPLIQEYADELSSQDAWRESRNVVSLLPPSAASLPSSL